MSFRAWSFLAAVSAHLVPESPRVCCMHTWAEPASHLRAISAPWSLTPLCGRLVRPQSCSQVIVAAPELDVMLCNEMLSYFYLLVVWPLNVHFYSCSFLFSSLASERVVSIVDHQMCRTPHHSKFRLAPPPLVVARSVMPYHCRFCSSQGAL